MPVISKFDIPNDMGLHEAKAHQTYKINRILAVEDNAISIRMRQLGFVEGETVVCRAVSHLNFGPLLFFLRDISVALTRQEAALIEVDLL